MGHAGCGDAVVLRYPLSPAGPAGAHLVSGRRDLAGTMATGREGRLPLIGLRARRGRDSPEARPVCGGN